jgi:hypothetical protein
MNSSLLSPQPSTHVLSMNMYNVIAAWNKLNYNYTPETRTNAIKNILNEMAQQDLGNYTIAKATENTFMSGVGATRSFFGNTFKRRGGKRKNRRGRRTIKMRS